MSRARIGSASQARSRGRQSSCWTNTGRRRFAALISLSFVRLLALASSTRSYAIPEPWWMPSSTARRLHMSSRIVPRLERAIRRNLGMISRSKKTCIWKTFSSSVSASRVILQSWSRYGSRSAVPPTIETSLSHASVWRASSWTSVV